MLCETARPEFFKCEISYIKLFTLEPFILVSRYPLRTACKKHYPKYTA